MKKKLSLLMVALVAIAAFAVQVTRRAYSGESPYSYTFSTTEKTFTADGTQTLGGVDWTLAVTWVNDSQKDYNKDSDGGMRIGSSSKSVNAMSLTSAADAFGTNYITSVKIKTAARSGANPKLTVKVGDTDFKYVSGDQKLSAATIGTGKNTEYEFVGVGQGAIAFEWDGSASSSKGAIYVKQIDVAFQAEAPAEPAVAEPVFGLDAGTYAGTQSVEITCKTEGATIYYTTDGTTVPTAESKEYTAPISITETTTIKAIAINGEDKSDVATATYTIVEKINGGTAEKPLTIAKAIELIDTKSDAALSHPDNKVYVKGAFKSYEGDVDSYKQLSYWLTDGTKDFEVYQGKYLENAGFDEDSKAAIDGKLVTVYGNIKKLQSTYEFDRGNYVVKVEEAPVDIVVEAADITGGDITAAIAAKIAAAGAPAKNITINLAADGAYTVSAPIDVPAGLTINGNGATIDGSALTTQMIQMSTTPSVGMNEKDAYLSDGIVVKDVKITGLKYQFIYGNKMKYLLATLSVENSIIAVDGTNKKTIFDFNGGGNASEIIIDKSTIYANPSNAQNGGLFSSQSGQGSIQDLGSDKQLFAITNSTIYNVAYGKTTNSQRRNNTAGMEYKVENSIIVNSGKSGQFIVGLNGGSANSAQTYTISGNVFSFDGADVSAAEQAKVQEKIADKELKSVAGIVTFTDAANGDFNGSFLLAPETTSMPETIGDPRWTVTTVTSYAITIADVIENGTVKVDKAYAAEGAEVTVTATPAEGCELEAITVTCKNIDEAVIVTDGKFTMPADEVIVNATFAKLPVDIVVESADITEGDITAAIAAKIAAAGAPAKNITINLAADGAYTVSAPIDVPAGLTINGNGATIDGSALTTQMIQMSTTPSVGMNEKDAYLSDGIVVKDVKITGLKYQFIYGNKMKYLLATLSVENSIIAVDGTNKKTIFDFNGGGNASEIIIDKSTIYANPSNAQNGGLFSSQSGQGSIQDLGSDKQLFAITNSTIYNVAYGKTTSSQRRNNTAGMEYKVENSIIVNSGKSGQFIVGLNGGAANSAQTYTISGNVFNFDGGDVSAAEEAKVQEKIADKELKSVAGIVTFADAANGDFNGTFMLAPETTSMPETIGDPRWTLTVAASYAITIAEGIQNGTVKVSYAYASADAEVTVTATPATGYELEAITVTCKNIDEAVIVTDGKFTMPADEVTVNATFKKAPVDIVVEASDITEGDITAAIAAKIAAAGAPAKNITINLAADGAYTVSAPIDVPAGLTINGNGATIDGSALTTQMIQMSTTPSVGMNEKDAYLSDGIVVKDVKITGLKYQFIYGNKMKYLLATLSVENSIIAVDGTNKKTIFDFNGGGNASEIIIDKSTIYANPSNAQNGGLFSSQSGQGSIQDLGSDKQLFAITNSTIYNVAYGKTTNSQRRNNTAGMEYKVENSIIVNSGKSGQFIVGLNGGAANSAQTYTISGNVFNFDGGDVSAAEEAKVQEKIADKELKSVAGIVTFADAANGDFNGSFLLAPETTSMPETIGDPRWTLSTVASYAITKTAATNGSYTVKAGDADITEAAEGTEVTITATPDENYELDQIKVEGTSTDLEVIVNVEGNVGTFTMPAADVTVIVTFKIATGINSIAADKLKDATIYTIGGQRVNSVKRGLYIINGKKVVIK